MDEPATSRPERILVIGRSPGVILDAAGILRGTGFRADDTKQYLTEEISNVNGHVAFVQGLAGIAGLIVAQVEGVTSTDGDDNGIAYDTTKRTVQLTLHEPA